MKNFTILIFFKKNPEKEIPLETYKEIYTDIFLKYQYPSCMVQWKKLGKTEKRRIIEDEYSFIAEKINEKFPEIATLQITRVVYDLAFYYFCHPRLYEYEENFFYITNKKTYKELCKDVADNSLRPIYSKLLHQINTEIIRMILKRKRTNFSFNWTDFLIFLINNIQEKYLSYTNDEYHVKFADIQKYKTLFLEVLKIEMESDEKDTVYLFRGVSRKDEDAIVTETTGTPEFSVCDENAKGFSNSYGMSFLAGYFSDRTACAYYYMKRAKYRFICKIHKHFPGDGSQDGKFFHIPPLHPILQLFSLGEYWHPRSKIFQDSQINCIGEFNGDYMFEEITQCISGNSFPEYLTSEYNCQEMTEKYKAFLDENRRLIVEPIKGSVKIRTPLRKTFRTKSYTLSRSKGRKTRSKYSHYSA
jgi:hypothetical protein